MKLSKDSTCLKKTPNAPKNSKDSEIKHWETNVVDSWGIKLKTNVPESRAILQTTLFHQRTTKNREQLGRSRRTFSKRKAFAPHNQKRLGDKCRERWGEPSNKPFWRREPLAPKNPRMQTCQFVPRRLLWLKTQANTAGEKPMDAMLLWDVWPSHFDFFLCSGPDE